MDTVSSGIIREDQAPVSSPVTPTPKRRNVAAGAEDDVIGDAGGVESQTINPDKPLQPVIDTYGSRSHAEVLHQTLAQSQPIPFRIPTSAGQSEDNQDDDPFGDAGLYETVDATRCEQNTEATASTDVVDEGVASLVPIDADQAEESTTNHFVAPVAINHEPHEPSHELSQELPQEQLDKLSQEPSQLHQLGQELSQEQLDEMSQELSQEQFHEQPCEKLHEDHGANTAASILASHFTVQKEPEKEENARLDGSGEDMQTMPLQQLQHQSPTQSSATPEAQPASPKGKQTEHVAAEPASDNDSAAPSLGARNGLVIIPIPPHYHKVRNLLWFKKTLSQSQPMPEAQPAPRTPSPKKPARKAPGTSGARRTRASKKTPSKVPAEIETRSPPLTRSAKKNKKAGEESAIPAASPPPRVTPIKKITLHFKRKPKVEADRDSAQEPVGEDESNHESSEASGERGMEHGYFYDVDADELEADAGDHACAETEGDVDAEEEGILL